MLTNIAGWKVPLARGRHAANHLPHHRRLGLVLPGSRRRRRLDVLWTITTSCHPHLGGIRTALEQNVRPSLLACMEPWCYGRIDYGHLAGCKVQHREWETQSVCFDGEAGLLRVFLTESAMMRLLGWLLSLYTILFQLMGGRLHSRAHSLRQYRSRRVHGSRRRRASGV